MIQTIHAFVEDLRRRGYPVAGHPGRRVFISDVKRVVADRFGLTMADLESECRGYKFAHPRQIAMLLSRRLCRRSYAEIGRRLGGRDHSTITKGCVAAERRAMDDPAIRKTLLDLTARLSKELKG